MEYIDLGSNLLSKVHKIFENLVRNRSSNLLHINMSNNQIEVEDFIMMMKNIEKESSFGNLHFKLRVMNLTYNPLKDFDYKV